MLKKSSRLSMISNAVFVVFIIVMFVNPQVKATVISGFMKLGIMDANVERSRLGAADGSETIFPEVSFIDIKGNEMTTSDLRGKVVFMNFWATWCPPCIAEMPSINRLAQRLKDNPDVVFVMVDVDADLAKSTAFMRKKDYDLPVYSINGNMPPNILGGVIPTTIILDKDGQLIFRKEGGADYDNADMMQFMEKLTR